VGQGPLTKVAPDVRDAWETREVDGLDDPGWTTALQEVLDEAARLLRFGGPVAARFDKLVLYGPDGHFVAHSDTLRSPDHVATLVVRLRSADQGGRMWVGDRRPLPDVPQTDAGLPCTVFHADIPHRVEPVEEGWRVSLVYRVHRSGPALPLVDEPVPADVPSLPTGAVAGGQVVLLRHRYTRGALETGALVGEDRALAAAWLAADPEVRVEIAELLGSQQVDVGADLHVQVESVQGVRGGTSGDTLRVSPGARMAASLGEHRAPGGFSGWTGNEGTASASRYRAGALIRRPGPAGPLHPEVEHLLGLAGDLVQDRREALEEHLPVLQASLEELTSGEWHRELSERVVSLPVDDGIRAIQDAVEAWLSPGHALSDAPSYHRRASLLDEQSEPTWALLRRGQAAEADHAHGAGWTVWDEEARGTAPEHLLDQLRSWHLAEPTTECLARLPRLPALRHLHIPSCGGGDGPARLPPLPGVEVLSMPTSSRVGVALDLGTAPKLRRLHWDGEVAGHAPAAHDQISLFPEPAPPAPETGLVHAVVSNHRGALPLGLCTEHLRVLDFGTNYRGEETSGLRGLEHSPNLRRLQLRGVVSLDRIPWTHLTQLTHLTLHRASHGKQALTLPAASQGVLDRLESLRLRGVDLSAVDLSRCTRLHTLHLDRCVGVASPPPGAALRSLHLDRTHAPIPASLPRLESLRVTEVGDELVLAQCPPRLRELHLAALAGADLSGLSGAPLRSLHLERLGRLVHPTAWVLPCLEALTLRTLPIGEIDVSSPLLRALTIHDLPVTHLPDHAAPELVHVTLSQLPLDALPDAWADSPVRELDLEDLQAFHQLPNWLPTSRGLQSLSVVYTSVTVLPSLTELPELHHVALYGSDVPVDDLLAATLSAAPALTSVQLVPPDPEQGSLHLESQLWAAGWKRSAEATAADPDADDIPF